MLLQLSNSLCLQSHTNGYASWRLRLRYHQFQGFYLCCHHLVRVSLLWRLISKDSPEASSLSDVSKVLISFPVFCYFTCFDQQLELEAEVNLSSCDPTQEYKHHFKQYRLLLLFRNLFWNPRDRTRSKVHQLTNNSGKRLSKAIKMISRFKNSATFDVFISIFMLMTQIANHSSRQPKFMHLLMNCSIE